MSTSKTVNQFLDLVKRALNNNREHFTCEDVDWDMMVTLANSHGVLGLIGSVIESCDNVPGDAYNKFFRAYKRNIYRDAKRGILIDLLLGDFESDGVECMPLKGYVLKDMYPSVEMRDMCDVDILIHTKDFEKADNIMKLNGFKFEKESPHEYIYTSNDKITIELHKSLVPSYNHMLYNYYGDGWRFAVCKEGYDHLYEMSREGFYVYQIAHTAKHYLNGGIGVRHVADIYILQKNSGGYDHEYINKQLSEIGIEKFHQIISRLCMVWFGNEEHDDETRSMEKYILEGALFGTAERSESSGIARSSDIYAAAVIKRYISYIFPKRIGLINRYPILKEKPRLYPFIVVYRWFDVLLHRRSRISELKNVPDKDAAHEFLEHCNAMGISNKL